MNSANLYISRSDLSTQSFAPYSPSSDLSGMIETRGKVYLSEYKPSLYEYVPVVVLSTMMTSEGKLVVSSSGHCFQIHTHCGVPSECATAFDYVMLTGLKCIKQLVFEPQRFAEKFAHKTVYNPLGAFIDDNCDTVYLITNLKVMREIEAGLSQCLKETYSFKPLSSISLRIGSTSNLLECDPKIRAKVLEVLALDVTVKNLRLE